MCPNSVGLEWGREPFLLISEKKYNKRRHPPPYVPIGMRRFDSGEGLIGWIGREPATAMWASYRGLNE